MIVVARGWRGAAIGGLVSLIVFAVLYFTVIKPDNNTANQALTNTEKQVNQVVNSVSRSAPAGAVPSSVTRLTSCIEAAGTNTTALQACRTKYGS